MTRPTAAPDRDLIRELIAAFDAAEQALQRRLEEAASEIARLQPLGERVATLEAALQSATERLGQALARVGDEREASLRGLAAAEAAAAQAASEQSRAQAELAGLESTLAAEREAARQALAELQRSAQAEREALEQELRQRSDRLHGAAAEAAERVTALERLQRDLAQARLHEADLASALAAAVERAERAERSLAAVRSEQLALSQRLEATAAAHALDRSEWQHLIGGLRDALDEQRRALAGSAQHATAMGQALQVANTDREALVATLRAQLDDARAAARVELAAWRDLHDRAGAEWKAVSDAQRARIADLEQATQARDDEARVQIAALSARVAEQAGQAQALDAEHRRQRAELVQERDRMVEALQRESELLQARCLRIQEELRAAQEAHQQWRADAEQRQADQAQALGEIAERQAEASTEAARLAHELEAATARLAAREAELRQERASALAQRLQAARAADHAAASRRRLIGAAQRRRALLRQAGALLAQIARATPWYAGARARAVAASFQGPARDERSPPSLAAAPPAVPPEVEVMSQPQPASAVGASAVPTVSHLLTLHDEDFVRTAYRAILGREVDASGLSNYLEQLRHGAAREQILCELALSDEGRAVVDRPAGLESLLRHPHKRPSMPSRVLEILLRPALRPLMSRMNALDNHVGARHQDIDRRLRAIEGQLNNANADVARRLDGVTRSLQGMADVIAHLGAAGGAAPARSPGAPVTETAPATADVDVLMENVRAELARIRLR